MLSRYVFIPALSFLALGACSGGADDARGVDHNETLLSVSASGEADMRPDEARFTAGVENWSRDADRASAQTNEEIVAIVAALRDLGVEEKDIQTSAVSVRRIDYGDRRGQFQASNTVTARVRDMNVAGAAVAAATEIGANILSGPDLRISDPEAAANTAYAEAYRNARKRAEVYAEAAGMEVSRVLYIRDAGGTQGNRYFTGAQATAPEAAIRNTAPPPPAPWAVATESVQDAGGAVIMPGQTTSAVSVQVDFALREK